MAKEGLTSQAISRSLVGKLPTLEIRTNMSTLMNYTSQNNNNDDDDDDNNTCTDNGDISISHDPLSASPLSFN